MNDHVFSGSYRRISDIICQLKVSVLVLFFSKSGPPGWRAAQPVLKVPYRVTPGEGACLGVAWAMATRIARELERIP